MTKQKRKLTAAEKAARKRRRQETMIIFINGKQKRVKRPQTIDGLDVEEFILRNADPIWLVENEMWEYLPSESTLEPAGKSDPRESAAVAVPRDLEPDDDIPF